MYARKTEKLFLVYLLLLPLPACALDLIVLGAGTCSMGYTPCVVAGVNSCGQCTCAAGYYYRYFVINSVPNEGCFPCNTCGSGSYKSGCGGSVAGTCNECGTTCDYFQYAAGCGGSSSGTCTRCEYCSSGLQRIGCTGSSAGVCKTCKQGCPAGQYTVGCDLYSEGVCSTCENCNQAGWFVAGCTTVSTGFCLYCDPCPAGQYRSGCSGTSYGSCEICTCPPGQYMVGCSVTSVVPGVCTACAVCPAGQYISGCNGTSPGTCMLCAAGSYSAAGASACTSCEKGKNYAENIGSTECTACSGGGCLANTELVPCTIYKNNECKPCPKPDNSAYVSSCVWQCLANYYKVGFGCYACTTYDPNPTAPTETSCSVGQYFKPCTLDTDGLCVPCTVKPPNAQFSSSSGSGDTCAWICNAGYYKDGTSCTECAPGTYSGTAGRTACQPCPFCEAGKWNNACGGSSAGGGVAGCIGCINTS
jgi:hypothetical protein